MLSCAIYCNSKPLLYGFCIFVRLFLFCRVKTVNNNMKDLLLVTVILFPHSLAFVPEKKVEEKIQQDTEHKETVVVFNNTNIPKGR